MRFKTSNRQILSGAIIFFYLIPLLFLASYSIGMMSRDKSWLVLSLGLLLIAMGSLTLILLLSYWESHLKNKILEETGDLSRPVSPFSPEQKVTSLEQETLFTPSEHVFEHTAATREEIELLEACLKDAQAQKSDLVDENEKLKLWMQQIEEENKSLQAKAQQAIQDFSDYKLFSEEQLKQKALQITTLQQMMEDQRSEMEQRQDQIQLLDTKVHDLSYEIKTLLHLNESDSTAAQNTISNILQTAPAEAAAESESISSSSVLMLEEVSETEYQLDHIIKTTVEGTALLKKCISNAQKLIGANYNSPEALRYREFPSSHYTIDQRRLFEAFRSERGALIIVYSPKENKLLFANPYVKTFLGWSPEKFLSDFPTIIQEGMMYWKKALSLLTTTPESHTRLLAKTRQGQEALLNCHLGTIPSGLFRGHVIGILYPA